jgi:ribosomal protein S12 methylthiotransferase
MYCYPELVTDELLSEVADNPKVAKYLDIPFQHTEDAVLKAMNRRGSKRELKELLGKIRGRIDGAVVRTSVIVGFPGETEEDFEELCQFLREEKLERAGVFAYSQEEGSPAALMEPQISEEVKLRRAEKVSDIQREIMDEYNRSMQGKMVTALCEGYDRLAECWFGRSYADAPEVDGKIFFSSRHKIEAGEFVTVLITGELDGDLLGQV